MYDTSANSSIPLTPSNSDVAALASSEARHSLQGYTVADERSTWRQVGSYVSIARPDHWFKNVFMLLGALLAAFYHPELLSWSMVPDLFLGLVATCIVASSNYVINEILDAPTDRSHRVKRRRPIPSGMVRLPIAYAEWISLGIIGLGLASMVGFSFFVAAAALLVMGLVYNVPPLRTKEWPYIDVLSESVNNPLRLLLGWFAVSGHEVPPMSLLVFYWMIGAFFMASKRFAEYRSIADKASAGQYRSSFKYYDENRLLVSMFFYATAAALFLGVFIIRFKLELLLSIPLIAGSFSYYLLVALKPESAAQAPERLYRERGLTVYLGISVLVFVALMFTQIPALYRWFNVEPARVPALWKFEP
ncbi:MAG: UbiA prenyltransferase family protein [Pirellulales bacterium]|nr:UbiA prenyltransferase family protein [Pirellulales bacterium]